jgi:hypothetical protein
MKKLFLIAAVALCAVACGKKEAKCENEGCCKEAEKVEVAAPAQEEEAAPAEEQTLIERAVELGEDVAAEVQK